MNTSNLGQWADNIQAFWLGGNDTEYIARKGSHQIFVYPCGDYPNPPSEVIQNMKRIETVEDFDDALNHGIRYKASYERVGEVAFSD